MCCLFGLIDTRRCFSGAEKACVLHALAASAEARGTDAAGVAYCGGSSGGLQIRKAPVPGHKLRFRIPDGAAAVMGHTRMTTQGSAANNRNNHPFLGRIGNEAFAFAHNGIIYNDQELRQRFSLPRTKIETDSYAAVQLLERQKALDFDSLCYVTEQLEGSLTYTVLDEKETLYVVRGDNPFCLIRFPKSGLLLYASTAQILVRALETLPVSVGKAERIEISCGEIVKITSAGEITRSCFNDSNLYVGQAQSYGLCCAYGSLGKDYELWREKRT